MANILLFYFGQQPLLSIYTAAHELHSTALVDVTFTLIYITGPYVGPA